MGVAPARCAETDRYAGKGLLLSGLCISLTCRSALAISGLLEVRIAGLIWAPMLCGSGLLARPTVLIGCTMFGLSQPVTILVWRMGLKTIGYTIGASITMAIVSISECRFSFYSLVNECLISSALRQKHHEHIMFAHVPYS